MLLRRAPAIHRVIAAEGLSNFGSMLSRLALPWLAALVLQASPLQMACLLLADVAAAAVSGLWLGAWVERQRKRRVMLLCDLARAGLLVLLAAGAWLNFVTFPALLLTAALSGVLNSAFELARSAWMAQNLPAADLPRRNAQLSLASSLSETTAFALGGWLYQGLGAAWSLIVDAASYVASALCLRAVTEAAPPPPPRPGDAPSPATLLNEAWVGLRFIAATPLLRALAGIEALLALGMALTGTAYMIFVSRDLALPTGPLGLIFALGGAGAALGAMLAPGWGQRFGPGRVMAAGLALQALGALCLPLAQGAGWWAIGLLIAHQIVGDTGQTLHQVHERSLRQTTVPGALLARTDAGLRSAGQLATLIGAGLGGLLGNAFGTRSVLGLAVLAFATAALLAKLALTGKTAAVPPHPSSP